MRISLYCGHFLRLTPPQENPEVTVTFAEDFPAKDFELYLITFPRIFLRICLIFIFLVSV